MAKTQNDITNNADLFSWDTPTDTQAKTDLATLVQSIKDTSREDLINGTHTDLLRNTDFRTLTQSGEISEMDAIYLEAHKRTILRTPTPRIGTPRISEWISDTKSLLDGISEYIQSEPKQRNRLRGELQFSVSPVAATMHYLHKAGFPIENPPITKMPVIKEGTSDGEPKYIVRDRGFSTPEAAKGEVTKTIFAANGKYVEYEPRDFVIIEKGHIEESEIVTDEYCVSIKDPATGQNYAILGSCAQLDNKDDLLEYINTNLTVLNERANEIIQSKHKTGYWFSRGQDNIKGKDSVYFPLNLEKEYTTSLPRESKIPSVAKPMSESEIKETFGLSTVRQIRPLDPNRAQQLINETYEGLNDIATVLDIPKDRIGFNGEIGLNLGVHVSGQRNTQYSPLYNTINISAERGIGNLAYEWWNALSTSTMATNKELVQAIQSLESHTQESSYHQRNGQEPDSTKTETALLFVEYLRIKLAEIGIRNDFVAQSIIPAAAYQRQRYNQISKSSGLTFDEYVTKADSLDGYIHPMPQEAREISPYFDKVFEYLRSEQLSLTTKEKLPIDEYQKPRLEHTTTEPLEDIQANPKEYIDNSTPEENYDFPEMEDLYAIIDQAERYSGNMAIFYYPENESYYVFDEDAAKIAPIIGADLLDAPYDLPLDTNRYTVFTSEEADDVLQILDRCGVYTSILEIPKADNRYKLK